MVVASEGILVLPASSSKQYTGRVFSSLDLKQVAKNL